MDGNGRWAQQRNQGRIYGHREGVKAAQQIILKCVELKISYLSLFTLSTENTLRPRLEVEALLDLFEKLVFQYASFLNQHDIRLHILGDCSLFSQKVQKQIETLKETTKSHKGLNLIVALNYGGRQEILQGVKNLLKHSEKEQIKKVTEDFFASFLPSSSFPPPDLIVRTGGEIRLSNFYLWSSAYSELHFTDVLWPDFSAKELFLAIEKYSTTQRKFGVL